MPPYIPTLTATPYRRRPIPGLAEDVGIDQETETLLVPPGLASDGDIDRVVSEALAAEGLGGEMSFDVAEVDPSARTRRATGAIGEALAQAFPASRSALRGLGASDLNMYTDSPVGFSPVGLAAPLRPGPGSRDPRMNLRADARPVAAPHLPPNAPAPAVAGAVPAGAPPAVSPSSPGAQPQGAGAATPPGQPAPSPVTPAPSSDQPTGQAKSAPDGVRVPGARENKGMDTFGMTDAERARLEEARAGDRRMRIGSGVAQGIGALLGTIGAATNRPGLAGLGMTGMQAGRSIPAGRRAEEVLADYERRTGALGAQQQADLANAASQRAAGQLDVNRMQAETQRLNVESEAALDRVRAADMAAARAARENSVEGMREAIRARIASMGANNPSRAAHVGFAQRGGELDTITDMDALERIYVEIGDQDVRRGGQGAGGSGGTRGTTEYYYDAEGNPVAVTTPGRRAQDTSAEVADPFAAPVAPTEAPGAVPATTAPVAAPGARPARPAARRGRPAPGVPAPVAAPAPAGVPAPDAAPPTAAGQVPAGTVATAQAQPSEIIDRSPEGQGRRYRAVLRGLGHSDESARAQVASFMADITSGDTARRNAANERLAAREYELANANAQGIPPGVTAAQWQRANSSDFAEHVNMLRDTRAALDRLRQYRRRNPNGYARALVLAGQNSPLTGVDPDVAEMARDMTAHLIPILSRIAGANVTSQELGRVQQSMGLGSLSAALANPQGFENNLATAAQSVWGLTRGLAASGIGDVAAGHILSRTLGGSVEYWSGRLRSRGG